MQRSACPSAGRAGCSALGSAAPERSAQRYAARPRPDAAALTAEVVTLASAYGRYGYRRVTALLRRAGWRVNAKRVERIWRREGLKVPRRQPKRGRLRLGDGSRVRLRPERPNHVWAYDFVQDRTHDGRVLRMLVVVDEFTRECLAIRVDRRLDSDDVLAVLAELFVRHGGPPEHVRSDNGPEFAAKAVRTWLGRLGTRALFIEPGSPLGDLLIAVPAGTDRQLRWRWENGHCESFNGKLRDELLDREIFYTLEAARLLVEAWRHHHNTARPHSALGYRPPAPEAVAWPTSALHLLPAGHGSRAVYH